MTNFSNYSNIVPNITMYSFSDKTHLSSSQQLILANLFTGGKTIFFRDRAEILLAFFLYKSTIKKNGFGHHGRDVEKQEYSMASKVSLAQQQILLTEVDAKCWTVPIYQPFSVLKSKFGDTVHHVPAHSKPFEKVENKINPGAALLEMLLEVWCFDWMPGLQWGETRLTQEFLKRTNESRSCN